MADNDVYTSVLKISNIKQQDYGEYNCQIVNAMGSIEARIRLQPKGPPEKPTRITDLHIGPNFVTLNWEPGFNGGISTTKYFVSYKKVPSNDNINIDGCGIVSRSVDWSEADCQQNVPCNVTQLEQHQTYLFKVKAFNTKGKSDYSQDITVSTRVDRIPLPEKVTYDPSSHALSIIVPITCLPLVAVVESISHENMPIPAWQVLDTLPLEVSGLMPTYREANLDQLIARNYRGKSIIDEQIGLDDEYQSRVRVKLCLGTHLEHCGEFLEAEREYFTILTFTIIIYLFFSWNSIYQRSFVIDDAYADSNRSNLYSRYTFRRFGPSFLQVQKESNQETTIERLRNGFDTTYNRFAAESSTSAILSIDWNG